MLYSLLRPALFCLDPEDAHNLTLGLAHLSPLLGELTGEVLNEDFFVKAGSLTWRFPVGLAAGLDKNAEALDFFSCQGFGALECGTVTLRPQEGNPRPRMFRYKDELSLRNSMGFPNQGLQLVLPRLKAYQRPIPLGVNIGKNKETSAEDSIEELSVLVKKLVEVADYFVVNVSSPNTPGLRALQEKSYLADLFSELNQLRKGKDLYLKIAPDLSAPKISELVRIANDYQLTGIIATNTTIIAERGPGGMSGRILREKARLVQHQILKEKENLELIAVGGITTPEDLFTLWKDGGKVAQVYTAYVFQGPDLLKSFYQAVRSFLHSNNLTLQQFFLLPASERNYILKSSGL
jgi:dihydroorotate dehydrogenase